MAIRTTTTDAAHTSFLQERQQAGPILDVVKTFLAGLSVIGQVDPRQIDNYKDQIRPELGSLLDSQTPFQDIADGRVSQRELQRIGFSPGEISLLRQIAGPPSRPQQVDRSERTRTQRTPREPPAPAPVHPDAHFTHTFAATEDNARLRVVRYLPDEELFEVTVEIDGAPTVLRFADVADLKAKLDREEIPLTTYEAYLLARTLEDHRNHPSWHRHNHNVVFTTVRWGEIPWTDASQEALESLGAEFGYEARQAALAQGVTRLTRGNARIVIVAADGTRHEFEGHDPLRGRPFERGGFYWRNQEGIAEARSRGLTRAFIPRGPDGQPMKTEDGRAIMMRVSDADYATIRTLLEQGAQVDIAWQDPEFDGD